MGGTTSVGASKWQHIFGGSPELNKYYDSDSSDTNHLRTSTTR